MKKIILGLAFILSFGLNGFSQNGLALDGVNDYVQTNITSLTGTQSRTIEAWIKTSSVTSQRVVVDMGTMPLGTRFTFNVLQGKIRIEIGGGGINSVTSVDDNQWHHVAVTYDNTASTKFKLYVDGVLDASGNITAATVNTAAGTGLMVGRRNDGVNYFSGLIDEVRVWNTVRTAAEIQANKDNQLCNTTGLAAYYKLNQGTANGTNTGITTATDDSGNSNNGTLTNFSLSGSTSNWTTGKSLTSGGGNTFSSFSVTACDSYTAPSGTVHTNTSGFQDIIPNSAGCDSIMIISLTITNSTTGSINVMACGSYTDSNGIVYTTPQTITETTTNAAGCDSVISINLTFGNTATTSNLTACDSYTAANGQVYTTSQTIVDTLQNGVGCDSVSTINLTIVTVDTAVSQMDATLSAVAGATGYQWINCATNTPIAGATNAVFVATTNGQYAVQITTAGGCTATSSCYSVTIINTKEQILAQTIQYAPNPVTKQLNINLGDVYQDVQVQILAIDGRIVATEFLNTTQQFELNLNQPSGIYFIKINTSEASTVLKIIKE